MLYRICTLDNESFWVEYRSWFFWHTCVNTHYDRAGTRWYETIKFKSVDDAEGWIDRIVREEKEEKARKQRKPKVIAVIETL